MAAGGGTIENLPGPCLYSGVFSCRLMFAGKVLKSPSSGVFKLHLATLHYFMKHEVLCKLRKNL